MTAKKSDMGWFLSYAVDAWSAPVFANLSSDAGAGVNGESRASVRRRSNERSVQK